MRLITISWKNIISKPWAMVLTIALFALGVGLISLLFQLDKQLQDSFEKNLAQVDLVIGAKGSPLQMILSSMYHIDAPTGNITIDEIRPFLNPRHPLIEQSLPLSLGDSYRGYRIVGTNPQILEWYNVSLGRGHIWEKNFEVVAGANVARMLNLSIGDRFKSSHGFMDDDDMEHEDAMDFVVRGILKPSGTVLDQLVLTTPQSFWLVHDHDAQVVISGEEHDHDDPDHIHADEKPKPLAEEDGNREITSLLLRFKGRNFQALNMQRSINENTDMQAATPAIEINRLFSMMDSGEQALRILAIVIILVSGLSIFISLYSSLRERRYELALMRVMGAGPGKLFQLIIIEGVLLAIMGYAIGMLLSHIGMEIIGQFVKDSYRYNFNGRNLLSNEVWLLLASLAVGFITSLIPAFQASKTDIAETLTTS